MTVLHFGEIMDKEFRDYFRKQIIIPVYYFSLTEDK